MTKASNLNIALPQILADRHSLFPLDDDAVKKWGDALPMANLGETTRQLHKALSELSHVACKPKVRLDILETLSPLVHHATRGMAQYYTNQPIVLPDKAEKIVRLADSLHLHLAIGFCQAYSELEKNSRLMKPKDAMATSLFNAVNEFSCILLRSYRLYRQPSAQLWLNLHQIYQAAINSKIEKTKVRDPRFEEGTILRAYLRTLMLACSQTHQMGQRYIEQVYFGLRFWCKKIVLRHSELERCTFLLNPKQDAPPHYREISKQAPDASWLGIDTSALTLTPKNLLGMVKQSAPSLEFGLPESVLEQLCNVWASASARAHERTPCNLTALMAVGINASHYYLSHNTDFQLFQRDTDNQQWSSANQFSGRDKEAKDPWSSNRSFDTREDSDNKNENYYFGVNKAPVEIVDIDYSLPIEQSHGGSPKQEYDYIRARALDQSALGYRLEWPETANNKIQTGEIIAINTGETNWQLATVRWLKSDDSHQMGVSVFANATTPCSARVVRSGLPSRDFQRGFMLPADGEGNLQRLLLPNLAFFSEDQTLELQDTLQVLRVKLVKLLANSNSYKLFSYREAHKPVQPKETSTAEQLAKYDANTGEFGNVWDIL